MKLKKYLVGLCSALFLGVVFLTPNCQALAEGLSISSSSSSVNIGDSLTVTVSVPSGYGASVSLNYDSNVLQLQSGDAGLVNLGDAASQPSSATYSFKAIGEGSCQLTASAVKAGDADANPVDLSAASLSVAVANTAAENEEQTTKSGDNSLASLTLSAGSLSPTFSYSVTNYTATVDYSVTNLAITAKPSNANATIASMSGNSNLQVGDNTVTIVVKAENGVTATYKITVTRLAEDASEESDDQEDTAEEETTAETSPFVYDGKNLFATTIPEGLCPTGFAENTISVNGKDYPCLSFDNGDLTLLYLEDGTEEGLGSLYIYDASQNTVYPYVCLYSENSYMIVLLPGADGVPTDYVETSLSIEGKGMVTAYTYEKLPEGGYYLLYGMNPEGSLNWYQYDSVEGTYQRFGGIVETVTESNDNYQVLQDSYTSLSGKYKTLQTRMDLYWIIFGVTVSVLVVIIGIMLTQRGKDKPAKQKKEKNKKKEDWEPTSLDDLENFLAEEAAESEKTEERMKNSPKNEVLVESENATDEEALPEEENQASFETESLSEEELTSAEAEDLVEESMENQTPTEEELPDVELPLEELLAEDTTSEEAIEQALEEVEKAEEIPAEETKAEEEKVGQEAKEQPHEASPEDSGDVEEIAEDVEDLEEDEDLEFLDL